MAMPGLLNFKDQQPTTNSRRTKFRHGKIRALIYSKYMKTNWFMLAIYKYAIRSQAEIKRHADNYYRNAHLRTRKMFAKHLRRKGINPSKVFAEWGI